MKEQTKKYSSPPKRKVYWATGAARRTKLFLRQNDSDGNQQPTDEEDYFKQVDAYYFDFDTIKKDLLLIQNQEEIKEVIHPADIIGVDLQLSFRGLEQITSTNENRNKPDNQNKYDLMRLNDERLAYLFPQCFNSQQTVQDPSQPLQPQFMLCSPKHNQVYQQPDDPDDDPMKRHVGIYNKKSKKTKHQFDQQEEITKKLLHYQQTKQMLSFDELTESDEEEYEKPKNNSMVDFIKCSGLDSQILQNGGACNNDSSDFRKKQSGNNNAFALLHLYTYPKQKSEEDGVFQQLLQTGLDSFSWNRSQTAVSRRAKHFTFEVAPCEDFANARSLVRSIRQVAGLHTSPKPKRYFVILNPKSGGTNNRTKSIYRETVAPMLDQCCGGLVDHDVFTTSYAGHAGERMTETYTKAKLGNHHFSSYSSMMKQKDRDISEYDAIIVMGGDGLFFEILQGLRTRSDYEKIIKKLKFGFIACGLRNGLATSIYHWSNETHSALDAMYIICKGQWKHLDLSLYQSASSRQYLSFSSFSWGILADMNKESEYLFGSSNETSPSILSAWKVLSLPSYRAKFSYLSAAQHSADFIPSWEMPSINDPIPSTWESLEDDFLFVLACHVSHTSLNQHSSPISKPNDGVFQILMVRKPISRMELISILSGFENGTHITEDKLEIYPCIAYRLEPIMSPSSPQSFNDLDGEMIESGPVQAYVLPSGICVFQ